MNANATNCSPVKLLWLDDDDFCFANSQFVYLKLQESLSAKDVDLEKSRRALVQLKAESKAQFDSVPSSPQVFLC